MRTPHSRAFRQGLSSGPLVVGSLPQGHRAGRNSVGAGRAGAADSSGNLRTRPRVYRRTLTAAQVSSPAAQDKKLQDNSAVPFKCPNLSVRIKSFAGPGGPDGQVPSEVRSRAETDFPKVQT